HLVLAEIRERPRVRPRLSPDPVVEVRRTCLPVDDPVRGNALRPRARTRRILGDARCGPGDELRHELTYKGDMRIGEPGEQRCRRLVRGDVDDDLADDRAR